MKLLSVETSSLVFSVAVSEGPRLVVFRQEDGQGRPSSLLGDLIQEALREAGWSPRDLDGFAVSIGPGSFTGLRVGVMTVKTLAWALKKPILPVSSLEVIAYNLENSPSPVVPFVDARKGSVYMASFAPDGSGSLQREDPDERHRPEDVLPRFEEPAVLVGDGLKRYAEQVRVLAPAGVEQAPPALWVPRADRLCRIASGRWPREIGGAAISRGWPDGLVDDAHRLVPQYLYSWDADIIGK